MKQAVTCAELRSRGTVRILAVLGFVLFVGLQIFAASATLHRAIHSDAGTPGHHCVITLLTQGQVSPMAAALELATVVAAVLLCLPAPPAPAPAFFLYRLSPSRAPPPN
jgi:hypothetical protein